ncbi:MAG: hypothetical protein COV91_01600 [Candidatus Taylorbacteria bacterium CG11_big_fil_rev_8_21_14_0_20_46_11]|uniref:Polymerase nucleotidyl transferase domain-containing protein n=1 Tax=Candidatus Taylorbacteria bacterium CG11_big_fil_rev_8_21_14_0_20_46_11 TaxID=1975025 RepID=A0A2H0KCD7_9BACT|nr:MAG: hypothetical protein COV91_01600 [Candidatus Taylorbacteria bacterium CG11_big_fil_rev_8_21_14_0_20_46_11]
MKYDSLTDVIAKLKNSPRVKGILTTGTTASEMNASSDIDLVVILDTNVEELKSVYTTIENRFSDIFFFDTEFVKRLGGKGEIKGNSFEGMFLEWLRKGAVEHDSGGLLSELKKEKEEAPPAQKVSEQEARDLWVKVNYNFIANARYYGSKEELYHKALEIRLLYGVVELITAYFSFRGIPWRGEKEAVKYFEVNDQRFWEIFQTYSASNTLSEKMKKYEELYSCVFFGEYTKWGKDFIIPISNNTGYDEKLSVFWNSLIR